jgi:monofunctional biosynthetic peptidoglycan transglycosylase
VLTTLLGVAVASVLVVAALRWLPVPVTAFMAGERFAAHAGQPLDQRHQWVPWQRISRHAAVAVIAAEDQKFLVHDGFDFEQIEKAVTDAGRGKRLRGASTISQQVAKNLFLWPGQSWLRKGLEAWFTVWIELLWPKQRILEVYLNSAQFGRGIWGVEAASRAYFGKDASRLSRQEAALLAAVLPSPTRYRVMNSGPYVRERQAWILRQMQALGGTSLLDAL